jgi:hypothetical protein
MATTKTPKPQDIDPRLFQRLYHILKELYVPKRGAIQAYNYTAIARALGIGKRTAKQWDITPPTAWYWEPVLIEALSRAAAYATPAQRNMIASELRKLPPKLAGKMGEMQIAIRFLADEMVEADEEDPVPGHQILSMAELKKISLFRVREAAAVMGIRYKRVGKGKDHEGVWYWPSMEEMKAEQRELIDAEARDPTETRFRKHGKKVLDKK